MEQSNFITSYVVETRFDVQRVNTSFLNDLDLPLCVKDIYLGTLIIKVAAYLYC